MGPRIVLAPAPIAAELAPVIGPMTVADILELAGSPVAVTPVSVAAVPLGGVCDLTAPVQSALQASPDVRARLPMIPADQRSVANAIMLWNAGWLHADDGVAKAAYAAIRDTVASVVLAAPDACRSQVQSGPRLILLPGEGGQTTVLALGSGQWTWQQVADTAGPLAVQPLAVQPVPARFSAANPQIINPASLKTGEE
jgi:hypothetical protein